MERRPVTLLASAIVRGTPQRSGAIGLGMRRCVAANLRRPPVAWHAATPTVAPHFGRTSCEPAHVGLVSCAPRHSCSDAASGGGGSSGSRGRRGGGEATAEQGEAAEDKEVAGLSASSGAGSSGSAAVGAEKRRAGKAMALWALPLFRKPAFPGFYHTIQIGDRDILDFLLALRRNGQAACLAGFMTRELPKGLSDGDGEVAEPLVSMPPTAQDGRGAREVQKSLRRDTGRVESTDDLTTTGTLLQIISIALHPNIPGGQVVVLPMHRIRMMKPLSKPSQGAPLCSVYVEDVPDIELPEDDPDIRVLHHGIIATMKDLLQTTFPYKEQFEQVIKYYDLDDPLRVADLVAGMSTAPRGELQAVLVASDAAARLRQVLAIVMRDLEHAKLQQQFKSQIEDKFVKEHRKFMLMQHLRQIRRELNLEKDDKQTIIASLKEAIGELTGVNEEASKAMEQELSRLSSLEPAAPEFNVSRTYLEWMTALPWGTCTTDNADISRAEQILNEDHYSLEDVKERILEHMAVSFLKGSVQGKIMCLVGPPGVGKTSIGKSVARALDRKLFRFSVGGLSDVAEIRGHRRTYIGAMPGKIIQALRITKVANPVILIDEVDKLGRDFRGDPSSALLEVLDPAQNAAFRDLYLDAPVDLSKVLFICTANVTETIPGPLVDRMEIIRIAGYVFEEKVAIANQYLIPQTIESHGIDSSHLELTPEAVSFLIRDYAREAGVRELRKLLEKVARKVALTCVRDDEDQRQQTVVTPDNLKKFVGQPPHTSDHLFPTGMPPGVVMGLTWTAMGGKTHFVEARGFIPGPEQDPGTSDAAQLRNGGAEAVHSEEGADAGGGQRQQRSGSGARLKVTGKLGKVMGESSDIALTYARIFLRELEPSNGFLDEASMHMNMPEGATPKDGPSAGVTMTSALLSLALDRPVKQDVAMTGELTLTGKVLRVGGIKEKAIAARRESVSAIVLPMSNHADYMELKPHLRAGLTAHFVDHFDDVYRLAFEDSGAPALHGASRGAGVVTVVTDADEAMSPPPVSTVAVTPPTSAKSPTAAAMVAAAFAAPPPVVRVR